MQRSYLNFSPPQINSNKNISNGITGSKIVPKKEYIIDFFYKLHDYIEKLPEETFNEKFTKVNYLNLYCYYLLQAITGHRPLNNPTYNYSNLSLNPSFIIVKDKISGKYTEIRYIPLCDFMKDQFKEAISGLKILYKINKTRDDYLNINIKNFFLIYNEKGKELSYNISNIKKMLQNIEIPPFTKLPKNFLRHHFRSYLFEQGVNQNIIDSLMGHVRLGNEFFSKYSSINPKEFSEYVFQLQENLLQYLKIEKIIELGFVS